MAFEAWAEELRSKLAAHYGEDFEITYNVELGGVPLPVVFAMRNRQPKTYLGFSMKNAALGPEACEFVLVLEEPHFGADALARVRELVSAAEAAYVRPGKDHGFTFISVVVLCERAEEGSAKALKKYKLGRQYPEGGWMLARIAVLCRDGALLSNKDGADLRDLLKKNVLTGA